MYGISDMNQKMDETPMNKQEAWGERKRKYVENQINNQMYKDDYL